jgi:hypothetical protein
MADAVTDQLAQASLEVDPTKLGPLSHEVISKQATSAAPLSLAAACCSNDRQFLN